MILNLILTFSISGTVLVQYTNFPTSGCFNWYDVINESKAMVFPVPVGIYHETSLKSKTLNLEGTYFE